MFFTLESFIDLYYLDSGGEAGPHHDAPSTMLHSWADVALLL